VTDVAQTLPRVLAGFRRTCRRCGASTTDLRDPRVGFTCCSAAAGDQVAWRAEELERLRAQARIEQEKVEALEAEARAASGYKVDEANTRAERARRGFARRLKEHYEPLADELKAEITKAKATIALFEATTVAYRGG